MKMRKMTNILRNIFLPAIALLFLAGCATDGQKYTRTIAVISSPLGAEIVVNGIPVAQTPLAIEVEATKNGHFVKRFEIIARPANADDGQFIQVKSFAPYSSKDAAKIPEKIEFNMRDNPRKN